MYGKVYNDWFRSFPLWERGLKLLIFGYIFTCVMSFPLWERGLKPRVRPVYGENLSSFPLWERGLKPMKSVPMCSSFHVVPLVGTWIETSSITVGL